MSAFAAQNDAELIYQPSLLLQHLAVYLPFNFDMFVNPSGSRSIYITDMNPAAALYGYTDLSNVDYSQCAHACHIHVLVMLSECNVQVCWLGGCQHHRHINQQGSHACTRPD